MQMLLANILSMMFLAALFTLPIAVGFTDATWFWQRQDGHGVLTGRFWVWG